MTRDVDQIMHMDSINAMPMLRFSEECNSPEIKQAATDIILGDFETALATGVVQKCYMGARQILMHHT